MPRTIQLLVIHCTASKNGDSLFRTEGGRSVTPVEIVDRWHRERKFARRAEDRARMNPDLAAIGYHWLIYTNGARATGRAAHEVGAHAVRYNAHSVSVCMVGTDKFTPPQWAALADTVRALCAQYNIPLESPDPRDPRGLRGVCGHGELPDVAKLCPGFSVKQWLQRGMRPLDKHVIPE